MPEDTPLSEATAEIDRLASHYKSKGLFPQTDVDFPTDQPLSDASEELNKLDKSKTASRVVVANEPSDLASAFEEISSDPSRSLASDSQVPTGDPNVPKPPSQNLPTADDQPLPDKGKKRAAPQLENPRATRKAILDPVTPVDKAAPPSLKEKPQVKADVATKSALSEPLKPEPQTPIEDPITPKETTLVEDQSQRENLGKTQSLESTTDLPKDIPPELKQAQIDSGTSPKINESVDMKPTVNLDAANVESLPVAEAESSAIKPDSSRATLTEDLARPPVTNAQMDSANLGSSKSVSSLKNQPFSQLAPTIDAQKLNAVALGKEREELARLQNLVKQHPENSTYRGLRDLQEVRVANLERSRINNSEKITGLGSSSSGKTAIAAGTVGVGGSAMALGAGGTQAAVGSQTVAPAITRPILTIPAAGQPLSTVAGGQQNPAATIQVQSPDSMKSDLQSVEESNEEKSPNSISFPSNSVH